MVPQRSVERRTGKTKNRFKNRQNDREKTGEKWYEITKKQENGKSRVQ